jgi:hypothetical protein
MENDILRQYNLPQEAERYYFQVDALRVYNIQNKIDTFTLKESDVLAPAPGKNEDKSDFFSDPFVPEMYYSQVDALRVYNIQNKIDAYPTPKGEVSTPNPEKKYDKLDIFGDALLPGWKNVRRGDDFLPSLSNFLGGNLLRILMPGAGQAMLFPRLGAFPRWSEAYATSLDEVVVASLSQCDSVELGGALIDLIKKDEDMIKKEKDFIDRMIKDEGFIKTGKYYERFQVQFGGSRGNPDRDWVPEKYLSAGFNKLTWIIRNTYVHANAVKNVDGSVTITYSLDPDEKLDLRPNGNEVLYDIITIILGFSYHDILRGNDQMRVKATWTTIKML